MAISLFEYNETAYNSAILMMDKEGKAAIIHPTGTGNRLSVSNFVRITLIKEFVGFHLRNIFLKRSNLKIFQR